MSALTFTVYGHPEPAGSKKAYVPKGWTRAVVTDANPNAKAWKQEIATTAQAVFNRQHGPTGLTEHVELLARPFMVDLTFYLARPKGHYGTGRNAGVLKPSAPRYPAVKPDIDKLSRAVLDALTRVLWRDDAQVVQKFASKVYGTPECVIVTVCPLNPNTEVEPERLAA